MTKYLLTSRTPKRHKQYYPNTLLVLGLDRDVKGEEKYQLRKKEQ